MNRQFQRFVRKMLRISNRNRSFNIDMFILRSVRMKYLISIYINPHYKTGDDVKEKKQTFETVRELQFETAQIFILYPICICIEIRFDE